MRNVYMVQASTTYGGNMFKAAYYPYASGLLVAYAFQNEVIKSHYHFSRFIFTREDVDAALESLEEPRFVGFSNYIWNTEYNKALAKKIKERYPECIILFGGHNVPSDGSFLEKFDYIDFLIHDEGEEAFLALLLELLEDSPDFSHIHNLSYRAADRSVVTNPSEVLTGTDYPSPYLTGVFDDIIAQNPDMQLDAILETSRGCPRRCAYCDWGCTEGRIKFYPLERVFREIEWFGEHKTAFIWGADANFGEAERDEQIVDKLIEVKKKTGYPERLRINYAKNKHERVFEINSRLEEFGLSKEGATLSFQSLNPDTLKAIGRVNMSIDKFRELIHLYRKAGIITYSELILGLPCETYDSFCEGIGKLLAAGQHRLIIVYNCEILPNSVMGRKDYRERYGIKTADVPFLTAHSGEKNAITERTEYVVATDSMNESDWIASNIFACYERSFHHYGIMKAISVYLYFESDVKYEDFYNSVVRYCRDSELDILHRTYAFLSGFYGNVAAGKNMSLYKNEVFGNITWQPAFVPHINAICRLEEYFESVRPLLDSFFDDKSILDELINYEYCLLKRPGKNNYSFEFEYDWFDYFETAFSGLRPELKKQRTRVNVRNKDTLAGWKEYAVAAAWFGKDGNTFNPGLTREFV